MQSLEPEGEKTRTSKTKKELQADLGKAHNVITQRQKELSLCDKKLKKAKAKIVNWEKQLKDFESLKEDFEQRLKDAKGDNRSLEKRNREQDELINQLQAELKEAQQFEKNIPEDTSTAKASFCIYLYPSQGHVNARIMNLFEKKETFPIKESDTVTIIDFISKYFPKLKDQIAQLKPLETEQKKLSPPATVASLSDGSPLLREFGIFSTDIEGPNIIVKKDQPFQVKLTFDPTDVISRKGSPLTYKVSIYVKSLKGRHRQLAGEVKGNVESTDPFTATIPTAALRAGTYRLEAVATLNPQTGDRSTRTFCWESSLINVY